MKLLIEVKPDFHNSILVIDYTLEFDEYFPEDTVELLPRYYNFKYSDTCTIDVLKYLAVEKEQLVATEFTSHDRPVDSVRLPVKLDGYYLIFHIVIPTVDWLEKVIDKDLSEYKYIYVTDGYKVYKYINNALLQVSVEELIEVNPFKTTISIVMEKIFSIDGLKHCYVKASKEIMDNYVGKCASVDDTKKFNRDFLWMTINVITYLLEWGLYGLALIILEDLRCHNFCGSNTSFKNEKSSCGCKK